MQSKSQRTTSHDAEHQQFHEGHACLLVSSLTNRDDVLGRVLEALGVEIFARLRVDVRHSLHKASPAVLVVKMLDMVTVNRREEVSRISNRHEDES